MTVVKYNIPVITEGGTPNANNLSDEMQTIEALAKKLTRSNVGQLNYTSLSSGISYSTANYSSDSSIYNKGETGLYNLLIKELDEHILQAKDFNEYGTGTITNTNWNTSSGGYRYQKDVLISGLLSSHIINITIDKSSMITAIDAVLCSTNDSYDGGFTVYAQFIPKSNIDFTYTIFK